jgi:hypothetical protein
MEGRRGDSKDHMRQYQTGLGAGAARARRTGMGHDDIGAVSNKVSMLGQLVEPLRKKDRSTMRNWASCFGWSSCVGGELIWARRCRER